MKDTYAFFAHARTAMVYGLRSFDISNDDVVLIPDYICSAVPQALSDVCKFVYYPVNNDFTPDWGKLNEIVGDETKAIMMVHYFGQSQHIEKFLKFSKEYGLLLIEDNSHGHSGLINERVLGTYGDIGFSSPRKILKTNSGGALYLNGDLVSAPNTMKRIESNLIKNKCRSFINNYKALKGNLRKVFFKSPNFLDPYYYKESTVKKYRADLYSEKIIKSTDWKEIASDRRNRWDQWAEFAINNGLKLIWEKPSDNSCPWALPVYALNKDDKVYWLKWGWEHGFDIFPWPSLSPEIIEHSNDCVDRWELLLCFSLHKGPPKEFSYANKS